MRTSWRRDGAVDLADVSARRWDGAVKLANLSARGQTVYLLRDWRVDALDLMGRMLRVDHVVRTVRF